jgi:hypothetical protein
MSQPGCWAYPDMLEVGVTGQNGKSEGGLTSYEQRSHFGLWCVISSPLTLSFDLGDPATMDKAWSETRWLFNFPFFSLSLSLSLCLLFFIFYFIFFGSFFFFFFQIAWLPKCTSTAKLSE